jgi:hypothetical protein
MALAFTLETAGEFVPAELDCYVAVEPRVARFPDLSHPAFAYGGHQLIRAEFVAGLSFHGLGGIASI